MVNVCHVPAGDIAACSCESECVFRNVFFPVSETLSSLMELYLNNNQVESVKEANHLRDLEKLIILDLSGNPMCKDPEYRLYSVYHLRRLKVWVANDEAIFKCRKS